LNHPIHVYSIRIVYTLLYVGIHRNTRDSHSTATRWRERTIGIRKIVGGISDAAASVRSARAQSARPSSSRSHIRHRRVHRTRRVSVRPLSRHAPIITTALGVMDVAALAAATETTTKTTNSAATAAAAASADLGTADTTNTTRATTTVIATVYTNSCDYNITTAIRPPKVRVRLSS